MREGMVGELLESMHSNEKAMVTSTTGNGFMGDSSSSEGTPLRTMVRNAVREVESRIILETLARHQWNRRRTAEALNISYRSLMYKMKYCKLRNADLSGNPEANQ